MAVRLLVRASLDSRVHCMWLRLFVSECEISRQLQQSIINDEDVAMHVQSHARSAIEI